jgi:hypothetical protein
MFVIDLSKNVGIFERNFVFERRVTFFPVAGSFWWLGRDYFIVNFKRRNCRQKKGKFTSLSKSVFSKHILLAVSF